MSFFEQEQASSEHQSWNDAGGGERHWEAEVGPGGSAPAQSVWGSVNFTF